MWNLISIVLLCLLFSVVIVVCSYAFVMHINPIKLLLGMWRSHIAKVKENNNVKQVSGRSKEFIS